jgi:hypothetical protein
LSGCSISYSFGKSSDSVSSISDSSSPSDDDEKTAYSQDVRELTVAYLQSGEQPAEYMREIGHIAQEHGVTDWERQQTTFVAIGEGLKRAGIQEAELQNVGFLKAMLDGNPVTLQYVRQGYAS